MTRRTKLASVQDIQSLPTGQSINCVVSCLQALYNISAKDALSCLPVKDRKNAAKLKGVSTAGCIDAMRALWTGRIDVISRRGMEVEPTPLSIVLGKSRDRLDTQTRRHVYHAAVWCPGFVWDNAHGVLSHEEWRQLYVIHTEVRPCE